MLVALYYISILIYLAYALNLYSDKGLKYSEIVYKVEEKRFRSNKACQSTQISTTSCWLFGNTESRLFNVYNFLLKTFLTVLID